LLRVAGMGVPAAPIADLDAARVGALVVAMGHPLGVRGALTAGIIHAIGPITPGGRPWIQADVRLAPGNSGGPLADASGRVMGLNAMVAGARALAIPMAHVERFVPAAGGEPLGAWTAQARRAGVRGVLRDDATAEELTAAVAATMAGLVVLHPTAVIARPIAAARSRKVSERTGLTPRELEILEMMAEGMSN